jgi:hypothetical protein
VCALSRRITKVKTLSARTPPITHQQIEDLDDSKVEMEDIITAADETIGASLLLLLLLLLLLVLLSVPSPTTPSTAKLVAENAALKRQLPPPPPPPPLPSPSLPTNPSFASGRPASATPTPISKQTRATTLHGTEATPPESTVMPQQQQQKLHQEHAPPPPSHNRPMATPPPNRPPLPGSQTHRTPGDDAAAVHQPLAPLTPRDGNRQPPPRTPRSLLRVTQPVSVDFVIIIK